MSRAERGRTRSPKPSLAIPHSAGAPRLAAFPEYGRLRRVLMHAPGHEIDAIGPATFRRYLFEDAIEPQRFREQHGRLVDLLRDEGVDVVLVRDLLRDSALLARVARSPNLVYTRDSVAVTPSGYIRMRMRSPVRRDEPALVAAALDRLCVPSLLDIRAPASLEGGDLMFLDEETLLVGIGNRTNARALELVRVRAPDLGLRRLVAIPLPLWAIHLDGTMMVVDRDLALVHPDSLAGRATVVEEGRPTRTAPALRLLTRLGLRCIPVTAYERQRRATNVITLGPRKLIGYAGHARIAREMAREGIDLIEVEGSELVRGGGGPRCMTAPIEREIRGGMSIPWSSTKGDS